MAALGSQTCSFKQLVEIVAGGIKIDLFVLSICFNVQRWYIEQANQTAVQCMGTLVIILYFLQLLVFDVLALLPLLHFLHFHYHLLTSSHNQITHVSRSPDPVTFSTMFR